MASGAIPEPLRATRSSKSGFSCRKSVFLSSSRPSRCLQGARIDGKSMFLHMKINFLGSWCEHGGPEWFLWFPVGSGWALEQFLSRCGLPGAQKVGFHAEKVYFPVIMGAVAVAKVPKSSFLSMKINFWVPGGSMEVGSGSWWCASGILAVVGTISGVIQPPRSSENKLSC